MGISPPPINNKTTIFVLVPKLCHVSIAAEMVAEAESEGEMEHEMEDIA